MLYSLAVLRIQDSDGIHNLGTPQWQLILCIAFVYCLLYLSLFKVSSAAGYRTETPQWQLILCIAFVYCLLYLSLFKVSSAGYRKGTISDSSSSALFFSTASSTCLCSR